jgi:hypothetical protein
MYDFHFGTKEKIEENRVQWLTFIKRMLPRYCNSIPDSEFVALHETLDLLEQKEHPTIVETGCGASTIVLLEHAMRFNGVLYSWDTNSLKGSHIRKICMETLGKHFDSKNLWNHWKFIGFNSCSKHGGIPILQELGASVDHCFLDSEHTWENLHGELKALAPIFSNRAVVCIDDGNYAYRKFNEAYINMIRSKLDLPATTDFGENNICNPFHEEVDDFLSRKFPKIEKIKDSYKINCHQDIFFEYYSADRKTMDDLGMEKSSEKEHRFDAWLLG